MGNDVVPLQLKEKTKTPPPPTDLSLSPSTPLLKCFTAVKIKVY